MLRAIPLVMFVAWAVGGYGLPGVPWVPGAPDFVENVAEASHRVVTPSGADPIYPPNHTIDGEVQDLGSLPNADFEQTSTNVGTPATNADLETAPTSVVTVPNGTFSTGTFANWTTAGTPTIETTGGPSGDWARLGSFNVSITSDAISVPTSAQELVYEINYISTTASSSAEVWVLSGAGYATSTKLLTDACNSCGTWSTSFVDITAYRGQSIKLRFRVGAGYAAVGIDTVDVQEVFAGYETTRQPGPRGRRRRRLRRAEGLAHLLGLHGRGGKPSSSAST